MHFNIAMWGIFPQFGHGSGLCSPSAVFDIS